MRVIVTTAQTPFIGGGARYHASGLVKALQNAGHEVESIRLPFRYDSDEHLRATMTFAESIDLAHPNGQNVDRLISLQFPGWGIHHPHHTVWLMHQHRAAYELFPKEDATKTAVALRDEIHSFDRRTLSRARKLFANSQRVADRLRHNLAMAAEPLHHPPPLAEHYRCEEAERYVFFPSRLESLKRQELAIRAMRHVRTSTHLLLAGEGGQVEQLVHSVGREGVADRVHFLGRISEAEKIGFYARCLAVCYIPFDEDYGYVTLEAMLSRKPVLTCVDSGGPLAFVRHQGNGLVVDPEPRAIASGIDALAQRSSWARSLGQTGYQDYRSMGLSWDRVVGKLLSH